MSVRPGYDNLSDVYCFKGAGELFRSGTVRRTDLGRTAVEGEFLLYSQIDRDGRHGVLCRGATWGAPIQAGGRS